jgi:hypothetical protein
MRVDVIGSTVNDDRGYSDCGQARQTGFQWRITRIASCVAHTMAIGADDRLDKVWIVERSSRSLEARIMWFCAAMATSSALRSRWRDSSVIMMLGLAWLGCCALMYLGGQSFSGAQSDGSLLQYRGWAIEGVDELDALR